MTNRGKKHFSGAGTQKKKARKPGEYIIYSHSHGKKIMVTLDELKVFSATLPLKCKGYLERGTSLSGPEQKDLLLLADMSMQVWGGGLKGRLPYCHIEDDYFPSFYIVMCKYLGKLIPEKAGAWVALCKFMGYDTVNQYLTAYRKETALNDALEELQHDLEHLYPEAYAVAANDQYQEVYA